MPADRSFWVRTASPRALGGQLCMLLQVAAASLCPDLHQISEFWKKIPFPELACSWLACGPIRPVSVHDVACLGMFAIKQLADRIEPINGADWSWFGACFTSRLRRRRVLDGHFFH